MNVRGMKVSVIGLGRSGMAASRLLLKKGAFVFGSDSGTPPISLKGFDYETGVHSERIFDAELIVTSPGVPSDHRILKEARRRGIEVIGEVELASQYFDGQMIAVTGTNGKTTTCALIKAMLDKGGFKAALGGNISPGIPLSQVVLNADTETIIVAEISTFQLETIKEFKPNIGIITNISADHMDRHKDFRTYVSLKRKLFINQDAHDFCILNFDDEITKEIKKEVTSQVFFFSVKNEVENGAFLRKDDIWFNRQQNGKMLFRRQDVLLPGEHNLENILAASVACMLAGCNAESISTVVQTFSGVPHRLEFVKKIKGITFVNNSMCTNPVAFRRSLEGVTTPFVLICGGRNKNLALEQMIAPIRKAKYTVIIGESAPLLARYLKEKGYEEFSIAKTIDEATNVAYAHASVGDTVLLSPGGSSFDMFKDFADRGKKFKESIRRLTNGKDER
ncbi:MAG: UDP-N-acetylmuramoyl-L-alanine--D-glutamate ligase [Candidatus Cloacimonadota bacterium]|nr:MAG: UDP-N-acetylmuramoyl-L-alanine--D-glutamate ligase [Candidatus Cloacimonadota bacterium]